MKILLIDDDKATKFLTRRALRHLHEVSSIAEVSDGVEGIEIISSGMIKPDVILLDWEMPRMNGYEFLKEYTKQNLATGFTKLYVLTSVVDEHVTDKTDTMDIVNNVFEKPLNEDHVRQIVEDLRGRN